MREADARSALDAILDHLNVGAGQAIMLHSDMSGVPLPKITAPLTPTGLRQQRDQLCRFVYEALIERLGVSGTLIVPTFTYSTSASGNAFHLESTPSEVGPLSEFVRCQAGAHRSLHPIFSIAAVGALAVTLTENAGPAAFGQNSPWQRFSEHDVRIITLGTPFRASATYVHHLEQCFGSPHRFHKVLDTAVFQNGIQIEGTWLAYLRFRSVDLDIDLVRFEAALRDDGALLETGWNGKTSSAVDVKNVDRVGYGMLQSDPWAFTNRRVVMEIQESIPADGPSASSHAKFELKLISSEQAQK